jgi:hypothetical protein
MARSHARILVTIWADPDFRRLSVDAQRTYLLLLSQASLNNAGVLPMTIKRWAAGCDTTATGDLDKALAELDDTRFIVVDSDTEEVLIRSFIRNDGIVKQPQMMKSALREALSVESPRLRSVLAAELRKLRRDDASFTAEQIDPGPSPDPDPDRRSPIQSQGSLPSGCEQGDGSLFPASEEPADLRRGGGGVGGSVTSRTSSVSATASKRGTRIPDDFAVTQAMVVWARRECPDVDGRYATAQFIDYWAAKAGKDAVKLDWPRTWQTWMRREQRDAVKRGPHLRSVPAPLSFDDPAAAFDDIRSRADGRGAARLLGIPYLPLEQPPSDPTPADEWDREQAQAFIDAHADEIVAELHRRTG